MIKRIQSFLRLSLLRKGLVVQAFALSFYTYILFRFFNRSAQFGVKIKPVDFNQKFNKKVMDIAWAIQTVSRFVPWKNVCRHEAMKAKLLCNYYKIPCLIFIGFKKDEENKGIQAHAWTLAGGEIITGFCNPDDYIIQCIYRNKWQ